MTSVAIPACFRQTMAGSLAVYMGGVGLLKLALR
jgi:hypothetical protein